MKPRTMLAYAILVIGSVAAFNCYTRLAELLPMSDATRIETTDALVIQVQPSAQDSQAAREVQVTFVADGKRIKGSYHLNEASTPPQKGEKQAIAYRADRPEIFLRAADYARLPRELSVLRTLMWVLALGAMVLPFFVINHKR